MLLIQKRKCINIELRSSFSINILIIGRFAWTKNKSLYRTESFILLFFILVIGFINSTKIHNSRYSYGTQFPYLLKWHLIGYCILRKGFLSTLHRLCIIYIDTWCKNYYPYKAGLPNFEAKNNWMQVCSQKICIIRIFLSMER